MSSTVSSRPQLVNQRTNPPVNPMANLIIGQRDHQTARRSSRVFADPAAVLQTINACAIPKRDIAAALGVKPCTLSNQLHGRSPLSQERAQQILDAVERLAAQPAQRAAAAHA